MPANDQRRGARSREIGLRSRDSDITSRLPHSENHVYAANVGIVRKSGLIVAALGLSFGGWAIGGCGHTTDPAVPCDEITLDVAAEGTVAAREGSPVIAFSDGPHPYVVHPVCRGGACRLVRTFLDSERDDDLSGNPLTPESPILITASGRFVVAIDIAGAGSLRAWQVDAFAATPVREVTNNALGPGRPAVLVSSMRNSDTVLVRNDRNELGSIDPAGGTFSPLADTRAELKVIAIGDRYIVGREILDGSHDRIHLVPVDPDAQGYFSGPLELATMRSISRVEITANDEFAVVTADGGEEDETFVFSIPDGTLTDRFSGAAVPGAGRLDALPGLRAASPDGSHLAYRTPNGALALRNLHESSSCLVRSASGGDHTVAGFAADAMLYMQADFDLGASHVFAFDTDTRTLSALDANDKGHHLVGAPPRLADRARPWAIGVRQGSYAALQEDAPAASLGLQGPVFLPRFDDPSAMWLADKYDDAENRTRVGLRRFAPGDLDGRSASFAPAGDAASVPEVFATARDTTPLAPGLSRVLPGERPCLATGSPGGWGYQCDGDGARQGFLASAPMPASETSNSIDPEVEDPQ